MTDPLPEGFSEQALEFDGRALRVAGSAGDVYVQQAATNLRAQARLAAIARAAVPADGTVLDIGANIGLSTLAVAPQVPAGRVLAFEPVPRNLAALRWNLAANGLAQARAVPVALGQEAGRLRFFVSEEFGAGGHAMTERHAAGAELPATEVPMTTLDAFAAAEGIGRIDLVKLDVEGFEPEVLAGGAATLARTRPVVVLELNSFCLIACRNRTTRDVLDGLLARFRHVFRLEESGALAPIRPGLSLYGFLHDHLVHRRAIDDLVCCDDDTWVGRYAPPTS